jgi:hypothetical protein
VCRVELADAPRADEAHVNWERHVFTPPCVLRVSY